jgi:hypothetical protein
MPDLHFNVYNEVDGELTDISSLLTATICVREHRRDLNVISDLLYLTEKKVALAKTLVRMMHLEHRKLEKKTAAPSTQTGQPA